MARSRERSNRHVSCHLLRERAQVAYPACIFGYLIPRNQLQEIGYPLPKVGVFESRPASSQSPARNPPEVLKPRTGMFLRSLKTRDRFAKTWD